MEYKLGTDPEVFVQNTKTGRFVCAHGMVAGTKHNPEPVEDGAIQVDGCALEFNIDPAEDATTFSNRIGRVLEQLKERVFAIDKDYAVVITPFARFEADYFENEVPFDAKVLGCDPDFNMNGMINPSPADKLMMEPIRTAAGHIHVGWTEGVDVENDADHFEDCRFLSTQFYYRGLFRPVTFEERQRIGYYGDFGAFRPKPYGNEFRGPSNLWIASDLRRKQMFESVIRQMKALEKK